MQRIQSAIAQSRCVFVLGSGLVGSAAEAELSKKGLHAVSLTAETSEHTHAFNAENLSPATKNQGIIVLVEPDFGEAHLEELVTFITNQPQRPQLFIVAKFYNRFSMPMSMMSLKMTHFKQNALSFFRSIPKIEVQQPTEKRAKSAKTSIAFKFIGRSEETATLTELLSTSGTPVCIRGIEGIGKRHLAEQVIGQHEWTRIPDLHINSYLNADALLGRLAQTFANVGNDALLKGLSGKKRISVVETLNLISAGLQSDAVANHCFIISGVHSRLNNRKKFHHHGLLEMVLETIWKTETPMKLIFLATQLPSSGASLREITLGGFSTEDVVATLQMWNAPEVSDETVAQIVERTKGHPLALRFLIVKSKVEGDYGLLSDENFARMSSAKDFRQLRKLTQKLTNKLSKDEAEALKTIAVFNAPIQAQYLTEMGINKKMRSALISGGLLEQTPSNNNRRYYAHELVHSVYKTEEIFNYDTLEEIAEKQMERSKDNSAKFNKSNPNALLELAYLQEANALFWAARKRKRFWRTPLPCVDAIITSATDLASRKSKGKTDFGHIADLQIKDGLHMAPNHPELLFLEAKRALHNKEKRKQVEQIFAERRARAMMPKFFLEESKMLTSRQPEKALKVLQEALEHFGNVEELWFKLANLLSTQGHSQAALQTVDKAIELHPTSPTYHSLRGDLLSKMGADQFEAASVALAKASELYSGNAPSVHILREIDILRKRSMMDVNEKQSILTTAKERLETVLTKDATNLGIQVSLAGILLDLDSEDYERIQTLLSPALKKRDNSDAHICKARLLIRQNDLIDVESHLDRAYKLSRNNSAINTVRGEYYLITGNPVLGLKAFQSALDASTKDSPEYAQIKRYVEQVTAILAAQANVNYAQIGEDSIGVVSETVAERPNVMIRKKGTPSEE